MKVCVPVKRVIDYRVNVQLTPSGDDVLTQGVKMSLNPFDEIALEEAIQMKERQQASEVVAVSCGDQAVQETLRSALAMGADRAIWIDSATPLMPLAVARLLAAVVKRESFGLVLMGKQSIDNDGNQTGQMLSGLLNWTQATFASSIEWSETGTHATVEREIDGGAEVLRVALPAVITADLRLNTPRFIALPNIMKAKSKTIETITADELSVSTAVGVSTLSYEVPAARQAGEKVADLSTLLKTLVEKGVLA